MTATLDEALAEPVMDGDGVEQRENRVKRRPCRWDDYQRECCAWAIENTGPRCPWVAPISELFAYWLEESLWSALLAWGAWS